MSARGTALITGASSGIGEAFARLLATEGFDLVLTARRTDRLEAIKKEVGGQVNVTVIPADLADAASVTQLLGEIDALPNGIDLLVNNAGISLEGPLHESDWAEVERLLTVNITSLTRLTHHCLTPMLAAGSGRILNVASVAAFHPIPGLDIYAASKAFVLSLSESLSERLRDTGVWVTAVCPGITRTDMVGSELIANVPPPLVASPEEVAREGFAAVMNREAVRVTGGANKLALLWAQHQPRWLVRGLGGLAARFSSR